MDNKQNWKMGSLLAVTVFASLGVSTLAHAVTYDLVADVTSKELSGESVPMWGFGLQGGPVTVPGPQLVVPPGDTTLTINLTNNLAEPVSIVIPGQIAPLQPVMFTDGQGRQRVRSLTAETPPNGGTRTYTWSNLKPGTYLYHSGTHPQVQVQMGLYGMAKRDAAPGQAYPGVGYAREAVVLYSEIDTALHQAVATANYGPGRAVTSTVDYKPRYFLVNGEPYSAAAPPIATAGVGQRTLIRFLNASPRTHVPVLNGQYLSLVAEDGNPYAFAREQYSVTLPALKTMDAILTPTENGRFALLDRRLDLTDDGFPDGGMLAFVAVDPAPVAANDAYALEEDGSLSVPSPGILANDTASGPLQSTLVSNVAHGALSLSADGAFNYTPEPDFSGTDSFTYQASDGYQASNAATVTLTVGAANDRPVANTDSYRLVAGGVVTVTPGVLANDSDPDGDPLTAALVAGSGPAQGQLTLDPNGSFTLDTTAVRAPAILTFRYTASDGTLASGPATVRITVTANTAPVAVNDTATTAPRTAVAIAVLDNDYDPDTAADSTNRIDPAALTLASARSQRGGAIRVVGNAVSYTPPANFTGSDSFIYYVKDTRGRRSNPGTVVVTVQ